MTDLTSADSQKLLHKDPEAFLNLLYQASRALSAMLDVEEVLERILQLCIESIGASSGSIIALDETGKMIESAFIFRDKKQISHPPELEVTFEHGLAGWVARHTQPVLIPDTSQDPRWLKRPDDSPKHTGAKSAVSAPIFFGDVLVGVITLVYPSPGYFTPDHLYLIDAVGHIAGAAMRNAFLFNKLHMAHQRYQTLFQDSIDPIVITDQSGKVIDANLRARRIFEAEGGKIEGRNIMELHRADERILGANFEALKGEHGANYESVLYLQRGEEIPVLVFTCRIQGVEGELIQWILRDISEQKKLDRMREDLMAMIYHDIRSPLSTVITTLNMLEHERIRASDEEHHTMMQIAKRSCEHIQRLIDMMLDMYWLEAGQPLSEREFVSPESLVRDAILVLNPLIEQRRVRVSTEHASNAGEVYVDGEMIRRVLVNLLENAIKFSPVEGTIWVSTVDHESFVEFMVRDQGPGIAPQDRQLIFDKFAQSKEGTRLRRHGLGLPFCHLVVNAHGGKIWVGDESPGACIHFTLPKQKIDATSFPREMR